MSEPKPMDSERLRGVEVRPGEYIRRAREDAGLAQRQLAEDLGVSHVFLGAWERGDKPIPDKHVDALAEALPGLSAADLRRLIRYSAKITIRPSGARERRLALAFAERVERGFTADELGALEALLMSVAGAELGDDEYALACVDGDTAGGNW